MSANPYLKAIGKKIWSEANDLKRTPEALAKDLGLDDNIIQSVINGQSDLDTVNTVIDKMCQLYPISKNNLWLQENDTDEGAVLVRAEASEKSSRIFERKNKDGEKTPYYEYRDTAMSCLGPFKPEWIKELRYVGDSDPNNPDVAYNKGHLMHQATFFIGDVNFYWSLNGKNFCEEMSTGDSNYITPFVPHSFTARTPGKLGLIIAVTYAGKVRDALDDFGRLGIESANRITADLRNPASAFWAIVRRQMLAESWSEETLIQELVVQGMDEQSARALIGNEAAPTMEDIRFFASALKLRLSDLLVTPLEADQEVVVRHIKDSPKILFPDDNRPAVILSQLARTPHQPELKIFEVTVVDDLGGDKAEMRHHLHEYVYNYGEAPVRVTWANGKEDTLFSGDSMYFLPDVPHSFARPSGAEEGHLAMVRIPGKINVDVLEEFAGYDVNWRHRAIEETTTWF